MARIVEFVGSDVDQSDIPVNTTGPAGPAAPRGSAASAHGRTVGETAAAVGLPTPTTDRLLRTLTRWRLLDELPSGRFAAALPLRLATGMDRTTTPAPGLTVRWGVLHDTGVGYLEHRPVPGATGMPSAVGSTAVSGSALGLVLRSFRAAGTDAPATPEQWPPVDRGTVLTRLTGVAVVRRAAGAYLVAVPVVDAAGRVVVALETEVTDLDGAFGPAVDYLNDTARQLTGRLARTT